MVAKRTAFARARKAAGYTQETLAEAIGVDVTTVGNWESGKSEPQPYKRPKLAKLLNVSSSELEDLLHRPSPHTAAQLADAPSTDDLRYRLQQVELAYNTAPSTSLLATASQNHGQITYLQSQVRSKRDRRDLVALEAESAVLMGQLVWDASQRRDHQAPRKYFEQAVQAARLSGDSVAEAYATLRTSYLALYGDKAPAEGLAVAQRAADTAIDASPALAGLALLHVAEANAMLGQRQQCDQALDDARQQLDRVHAVDTVAEHFTTAEIDRLAGSCYLFLGLSKRAEATLRSVACELESKKKSQSIVLGNLTLAYIQQGELHEAARSLHQTIDALETSRGGGGFALAFEAGRKLAPWRQEVAVQELHDRLFTLMATP
ncbi:helix-turn-helix domain-containing protein [Amycolatopsis japonica]|uniref:helix-turn-helix domain-containing protein n=1 Tax=Amycolatopsis japonica TaxID=208439 RepID=UPI0033DF1EE2